MRVLAALSVAFAGGALVMCGRTDLDVPTSCTAGQSVACTGPGGCSGGQICGDDGTRLGPCDCSLSGQDASDMDATVVDATGIDAKSNSDANAGADGAADGSDSPACPPGLTCNVSCPGGGTTTITGTVYDPAAKNPLYNVAVYVPATPLQPLPKGVLTGADACSCAALFKSGAMASTVTATDGTFTLTNVPVGSSVPLVLQAGKWRRLLHVNVTACQANAQPDKSLALPSTVAAGDTDDNIPDIAVSTGGADTLECLLRRVGLPASEYVAGAATTGHVHVFSGGSSAGTGLGGVSEVPGMAGAPPSYTTLWSNVNQLMPYDITLLSCEGGETYNANPPALEQYLNAGGRVFASHYHYAWFSGPMESGQSYSAPADWGTNLATWTAGANALTDPAAGTIVQTFNGSTAPFPRGIAFYRWLGVVGALGQDGVPANDLPIYQSRLNASVGPANRASQPWITVQAAQPTEYFSFDTPVNVDGGGGGVPTYCGRAVFSDLHASGNPVTMDSMSPPSGCSSADLSPQEKALEFMLFDLSNCVVAGPLNP